MGVDIASCTMDPIRVKALDPKVKSMIEDFVRSDGERCSSLRDKRTDLDVVFSEAMPGTVVGIVYKNGVCIVPS
jgi:hypothetical protein